MLEALNQNMQLVVSVISLGILIAIYFAFKFRIDFWWLNFWYGLPLIGKTARLSGDATRSSEDLWTNSERTLCSDYKQFVDILSESEFGNCAEYLRKAEDAGRSPLPAWMLLLLAPLVAAEGLGFSYLLGTWMAMEGSEDTHQLLMVCIVFVLATVLLFVTHAAGHQLYRSNLIKRCDQEWRDEGQQGYRHSESITLANDQSTDDSQKSYTQCLNRVGKTGGYTMVVVAVISIVLIAALSTWMRVKHLDTISMQETIGTTTSSTSSAGNPFDNLPAELTAAQVQADHQAKSEIQKSNGQEGMAAFLMLAFIFVVTQIVGIAAGYKWGFAGEQSKKAYARLRGFATYAECIDFYEPIIETAEATLTTLQQKMSRNNSNINLRLFKTFRNYLDEKHAVKIEAQNKLKTADTSTKNAPTVEVATDEVAQHVANIESMGEDKEKKKQYLISLSETIRPRVMEAIKASKIKREAAQAKLNAEMDGVL